MTPEAQMDLRSLPRRVSGSRSTMVWGMALLIVIESVVVLSLLTSYFYLRVRTDAWPPAHLPPPDLTWSSAATAAFVLSVVPVAVAERGIRRGGLRRLQAGLPLGLLLVAAYLVLTFIDLRARPTTWSADAYASIVWTITGYQIMHVMAVLVLGGAITALAWRGHFSRERRVAVQVTALYWYFAAAAGLLSYVVVYLSPRFT